MRASHNLPGLLYHGRLLKNANEVQIMPMTPTRDELLTAGEIQLHCVQWGNQGSPVLCIHGLTANAFAFQSFADDLARDHRVLAYDLRGRGDSEKPAAGYSIPRHTADLCRLIDVLALEQPILIGHSLGAMIALYFAAHFPHKLSKLVLVDAGTPLPWETPATQPAWLTAAIDRLGTPIPSYAEYISRLKTLPFLGPYWNIYTDIYYQHDVYAHSDGSVTAKAYREGILEEGTRFQEGQPAAQWARVKAPTLLLRAGQGLFTPHDQLMNEEAARAARATIASCRYVNFPTLNHYTILFGVERGPVEAIRAFIDEQEPREQPAKQHEVI
jgi:pimeloyl-ACP methyl ester carboxylesterase